MQIILIIAGHFYYLKMRTKCLKTFSVSLSILVALLTASCASTTCCLTSIQETDNATRYVVIGFGVITIPKQKGVDGILATKTKAVGLVVTNQPGLNVGLGYSSSSVVAIPSDTSNTVVEVSTCMDEGIFVNAKSSQIQSGEGGNKQ